MKDLVTRIDRLVVVTSPDEAKGPVDQARKHRSKVRNLLHRERMVGRKPAGALDRMVA